MHCYGFETELPCLLLDKCRPATGTWQMDANGATCRGRLYQWVGAIALGFRYSRCLHCPSPIRFPGLCGSICCWRGLSLLDSCKRALSKHCPLSTFMLCSLAESRLKRTTGFNCRSTGYAFEMISWGSIMAQMQILAISAPRLSNWALRRCSKKVLQRETVL